MSTTLDLVKDHNETYDAELEKRQIPRFPFSQMIVKSKSNAAVYEVMDISCLGMGINSELEVEKDFEGTINWRGNIIDIKALVKWREDKKIGFEFSKETQLLMKDFLSLERIVATMRPFHKLEECPGNLLTWLYTEGPFEILVFRDFKGAGLYEKFQIILMQDFIEWEVGQGLVTGKIFHRRPINAPLTQEDEFLFKQDPSLDIQKIEFASRLLNLISESFMPKEVQSFLQIKLRI